MTDQVQQAAAKPQTAEQQEQQKQEQLQMHINAEIQKGVQLYNLDVQRLTIVAQGLEALHNVSKETESNEMATLCLALRTKFEDAIGIYVTQKVSCETPVDSAVDTAV
jgi:hypothetical protein